MNTASWKIWQCPVHWFFYAQPWHLPYIDYLRIMATDDFGNLYFLKIGGAASHFYFN